MQYCVLPKKDKSFPQIDSEGVYSVHFCGYEKHLEFSLKLQPGTPIVAYDSLCDEGLPR